MNLPQINFNLKKPKKESRVQMTLNVKGIRIRRNVDFIPPINPKDWNEKKSEIKGTHIEFEKIGEWNEHLTKLKHSINIDMREHKSELTSEVVASIVDRFIRPNAELVNCKIQSDDLFIFYNKFLNQIGLDRANGSIRQQQTTRNKLQSFSNKYYGGRLTYQQITNDLMTEFYRFLFETSTYIDLNGKVKETSIDNNSTANGHIKRLKTFLNYGLEQQWHSNIQFKSFKRSKASKHEETDIITLRWEDFLKLWNLEFSNEKRKLERVRDVFCFSCVTGLRHSDYSKLLKNEFMVVDEFDKQGKMRKMMKVYIQKNGKRKPVKIPYSEYGQVIVNKYTNESSITLLPHYSNQKMNEYVKELMQLIDLDEPVTLVKFVLNQQITETYKKWQLVSSHTGRKTFIHNCVKNKVPLHVLCTYTGHSKDSKELARYYDVEAETQLDYFPESMYQVQR